MRSLQSMAIEDLRNSDVMSHLLDSLKAHQDIGHYGRLTFAMVARHFVAEDELGRLLTADLFKRSICCRISRSGLTRSSRQTEIDQHGAPRVVELDVARLDVVVND